MASVKWIKEITYGAFDGQGSDMTGYDVTFTGAPLADLHDLADAVSRIILHGGKSHALRVTGPYPSDMSVYKFVQRFQEDGSWYLVGVGDGLAPNLWDTWLHYRVIRLMSPSWAVLKCNELVWKGAQGPAPLLPVPAPKCLLDTTGMDTEEVWKWLDDAPTMWHILTTKHGLRNVVT